METKNDRLASLLAKIPNRQLLDIAGQKEISMGPIIDLATCKLTAAMRMASKRFSPAEVIHCRCGARSDGWQYLLLLPEEIYITSLGIHLVTCHRAEVPPEHLALIVLIDYGLQEPTDEEVQHPRTRLT